MSMTELGGRKVELIGASHPLNAMYSAVIRAGDAESNALLLELTTPSFIGGQAYAFALARPREGGGRMSSLAQRGRLSCNITWIPNERFDAARPFDVSWWRGGAAATADVVLV